MPAFPPSARRSCVALIAVLFAAPAPGCAARSDQLQRELEALRHELAAMRVTPTPAPAPAVAVNPLLTARPPVAQPAGPPAVRAPDLGAPPPLPVVRLAPRKVSPFERGAEPVIRIGQSGRVAPPVATGPRGPLEYDRIDEEGNLLDKEGRIVYRAGTGSPGIDTDADELAEERLYEDPHESPSRKVARSMRAPRVTARGDREPLPTSSPRPGVVALDDGMMLDGPGEAPARRLKQFTFGGTGDADVPGNRDERIRVEARQHPIDAEAPIAIEGQPATSPRLAPPTLDAPEPAGVSVPGARAQPAPAGPTEPDPVMDEGPDDGAAEPQVAQPAPSPASFGPVRHAPGPQRVIHQKVYRGSREARVQKLYKKARQKMTGGDLPGSAKVFERLLTRYPDHDLADNSLYWLGETAYAEGNWAQALAWFQDVVLRYPGGNKVPDSMLKSALCYAQQGETSYATQMLTEVETLFASLPVAEVARSRRLALAEGVAP